MQEYASKNQVDLIYFIISYLEDISLHLMKFSWPLKFSLLKLS